MGAYLEIARRVKEKRRVGSDDTGLRKGMEPWDEDAVLQMVREASRSLADRYVEGADLSVLDPWEDDIEEAHKAEDMAAFRAAVRGFVQAGLHEFKGDKATVPVQKA
jgi:hypothetical protein